MKRTSIVAMLLLGCGGGPHELHGGNYAALVVASAGTCSVPAIGAQVGVKLEVTPTEVHWQTPQHVLHRLEDRLQGILVDPGGTTVFSGDILDDDHICMNVAGERNSVLAGKCTFDVTYDLVLESDG